MPIATIRLTEPVGGLPTGTVLNAVAIVRAAGHTFYEINDETLIDGSKAEEI